MENKELQEVVDVILQALLEMEERFNKKFDEINEWFDKLIAQTSHRQKQQAFAYCLVPCLFSQFLRASDTRYQFKQG